MANPIPDGYHSVTPYIFVKGANEALEFYKNAFGAEEMLRLPGPDGESVMHAEMKVGDSIIMLSDENPQMGAMSPETRGGPTGSIMLYVEDVDASYKRALDAGAKEKAPPTDMFWGDRFSQVIDPFGHLWAIATHTEDVPPEEIGQRMKEWSAQAEQQS